MKVFSLIASSLVVSASAFAPSSSFSSTRYGSSLNLAVGQVAPDFSLPDQNGKTITRSAIKKPLVIFFYPADNTPGCTLEADAFNKALTTLRKKYNAEVVGISSQDVKSKNAFSCDLDLKYPILADVKEEARKAFQVPKALLGLFPGRVTYILDAKGVCVQVFDNLADAASHVDKAVEALEGLKKK